MAFSLNPFVEVESGVLCVGFEACEAPNMNRLQIASNTQSRGGR